MTDVAHAADAPSAPFPGIKPFSYRYRDVFFARQAEIRALMRLVILYRGVLVYGASQRGKSSLLNAGLIPEAIANGYQPERIRVQARRGAECVVDRIAVSKGPHPSYLPSLFDMPGAGEVIVLSLRDAIARVREVAAVTREPEGDVVAGGDGSSTTPPREGRSQPLKPLLIFDQFEEWITAFEEAQAKGDVEAAEIQADILREITALINDHRIRVKVVLAFREDYLPRLDPFFGECPTLSDHYLRLAPLSPRRSYKLIRGPFMKYPGRYACEIAPVLARKIQRQFIANDAAEVSLTELQIVCRSLHEDPVLASMLEPGGEGVRGILQQYFRTRLDRLPEERREPAVALLSCLVSAAGTRKTVDRENLLALASAETPERRELFADALVDLERQARLVRREWRRDLDYFEISSEFLVDWIKEQASARKHRSEQRRLIAERERAQAQAAEMRARLEEQTKLVAAEQAATEAIRARLQAETDRARAEAAARAKQRLVRWTAYVALTFVALFVIATLATIAAISLSHEHVSRLWIQAAASQLERDPQLSTLLAIRAIGTTGQDPGATLPAAQMALTRAVRSASHLNATEDVGGSGPTMSSDGKALAFVGQKNTIELRHGAGYVQKSSLEASDNRKIIAVAFLPGNAALLAIYFDGSFDRIEVGPVLKRSVAAGPPGAPQGEPASVSPRLRYVTRWALDTERERLLVSSSTDPSLSRDGSWQPGSQWISLADTRTGKWLHDRNVGSADAEAALSGNGRRYALIGTTGEVRLMEADGQVVDAHHFERDLSIRLNSDGTHVLGFPRTDAEGTAVSVWRAGTAESWGVFLPAGGEVVDALFTPDTKAFAVVQSPGIAQVWDISNRGAIFAAPIAARGVAFGQDSSELLCWTGTDAAELWSLRPATRQLRLVGHEGTILGGATAASGGAIVTLTASKLRFWARANDDKVLHPPASSTPVAVALSPDGTIVVTAARTPQPAVRSGANAGQQLAETTRLTMAAIADGAKVGELEVPAGLLALSYSPHGGFIAAGFDDGRLVLAAPHTDRSRDVTFKDHQGRIGAVAFGHDDRLIGYAVQKDARNGVVVVRDIANGTIKLESEVAGQVTSLAFARDDRTVGVSVFEPQTYEVGLEASDHKTSFQKLSVDGSRRVQGSLLPDAKRASASPMPVPPARPGSTTSTAGTEMMPPPVAPPSAQIADQASAVATIQEFPGGTAISDALEFAVSAEADGQLVLYKALDQRQVLSFADARVVSISPDGRHFAVASGRGDTRLYTSDGLLEPVVLRENGSPIVALAFAARMDRIASLTSDGVITIYAFDIDTMLEKAKRIVGDRPLTESECAQSSLDLATCSADRSTWSALLRRIVSRKER